MKLLKSFALVGALCLASASFAMAPKVKAPATPEEIVELDRAVAVTSATCDRVGVEKCRLPGDDKVSSLDFLKAQPARARRYESPGESRAGYEYGMELHRRICANVGC